MNQIHKESRAARVLRLYEKIDKAIDGYHKTNKIKSSCKKGCASCCNTDFPFSGIEMDLITWEMKDWSKEKFNKVMDRAEKSFNEVYKKYPEYINNFTKNATGSRDAIMNDMSFMPKQEDFRCPLLDDDNSCMVYSVRPVACRLYGTALYKTEMFECKNADPDKPDLNFLSDEIEGLMHIGRVFERPYPMIMYFYNRFLKNNKTLMVRKDFGLKFFQPEADYIFYVVQDAVRRMK